MSTPHNFYIPVMGSGFTIDSPLFVAKYGISSVISLVDDTLIEQMRKYWCEKTGEPYAPINSKQKDARSRRITAYLNLLNKLVKKQVAEVRTAPFAPGTEITKYFAMLSQAHPLRFVYESMLKESDVDKKTKLQEKLRQAVTAGDVEVNIMTKLDRYNYVSGEQLPYEYCDAAAALRGFAESELTSTIEFSAGFNPNLYGYLTKFPDFFPDENAKIKKKVCLKVSDFRSAIVQGKYLAKKGIWVSEYRIESPLNCGGHAFINDGQLLGPILAEFKQRKDELVATLHDFYKSALANIKKFCAELPQKIKITAQGGIGTSAEHQLLLQYYDLDATGWGTPFLLVPEVTNVDDQTLHKLMNANEGDVFLSASSPLGVPFWNLKNSVSEEAHRDRINNHNPGSFCVKGHLRFNQEFTEHPICRASREYQSLKLQELERSNLPSETLTSLKNNVLSKACICHELGGGALLKKNFEVKINPAVCPGPNIINFKKIATLAEMVNHIYGYCSLLVDAGRPHMFIKELQLQVNYLLSEFKNLSLGLPARSRQKLADVKQNLSEGIEYYRGFAKELLQDQQEKFLQALEALYFEIEKINLVEVPIE